jgi:membrane-associated phospholipid phosphatase
MSTMAADSCPSRSVTSRGVTAGMCVAGAVLLAALTSAVALGQAELRHADLTTADWGYHLTYGQPGLTAWWLAVARYGQPIFLRAVLLLAAGLLWWRHQRRLAVWLLCLTVLETMVAPTSKFLLDRPRPHWSHPIAVEHSPSYPSGHAAGVSMLATVVTLLALILLRSGWSKALTIAAAVIAAFIVSLDRIMLGVHYLTDVLGGALLGAELTLLCWLVLLLLPSTRRLREPQDPGTSG